MHPSTFNCHTHRDFFRFYRKACANKKVFSCDLNWDSVGTFLSVVGREFQRDGAMKLKERCPNDLRCRFGILSSFSLEDRRDRRYIECVSVRWFDSRCTCLRHLLVLWYWVVATSEQSSVRGVIRRFHFHKLTAMWTPVSSAHVTSPLSQFRL